MNEIGFQAGSSVPEEHVDHDAASQVDHTGGVDRVVPTVRSQERGLIDTELGCGTDSGRIINQTSVGVLEVEVERSVGVVQ